MQGADEKSYHAAIRSFDTLLSTLRHAVVCSVTSFEVERCSPVIAEVFGHLTSRACREFDEIMAFRWIHGDIKGVLRCVRLAD
jgi:hypothetical protein